MWFFLFPLQINKNRPRRPSRQWGREGKQGLLSTKPPPICPSYHVMSLCCRKHGSNWKNLGETLCFWYSFLSVCTYTGEATYTLPLKHVFFPKNAAIWQSWLKAFEGPEGEGAGSAPGRRAARQKCLRKRTYVYCPLCPKQRCSGSGEIFLLGCEKSCFCNSQNKVLRKSLGFFFFIQHK